MSFQFPAAAPNDPSDVALAIETAGALWRKGDSREALRWLRRAAETAETEGDDMRALSLARAAADLKDMLPAAQSIPPSASGAPPPASAATASRRPSVSPSAPPPARASVAPAPRSIPPAPALVSSLTKELGVEASKLEAWAPPSARSTPKSLPPTQSPTATVPASTPQTSPPRTLDAAPQKAQPPALPSSPVNAPVSAPSAALDPATPVAPAVGRVSEGRSALRVSVEVLSKGSGSLLVRVLGEGEQPPAGAREALLVPIEAGVDLQRP